MFITMIALSFYLLPPPLQIPDDLPWFDILRNHILNKNSGQNIYRIMHIQDPIYINSYYHLCYMYQQSRSQFIYLMKYLLLQNLFPHLDTLISSIAENTTPRIPTTIPKMVTATLHAICNQFNFFHFSFRWKTHGKMKHRLVPVKLPSRPMTKPK